MDEGLDARLCTLGGVLPTDLCVQLILRLGWARMARGGDGGEVVRWWGGEVVGRWGWGGGFVGWWGGGFVG